MMSPFVSLAAAVPSLDGAWKIVVFLIMLSVLVVLHEAGHMIAARLSGVRVTDFALGFGPTLLKWTSGRSGTNYRLNLLPIGGYCGMQGLDAGRGEVHEQRELASEIAAAPAASGARLRSGGTAVAEPPAARIARAAAAGASDPTTPGAALATSFQAKPTWKRLAIVLAGPVANFILAFAIMLTAIAVFGAPSAKTSTKVGPVMADSVAQRAGLETGDSILAIDGRAYADGDALIRKIHASAGVPLQLTFSHAGVARTVRVVPKAAKTLAGGTEGRIGFVPVGLYAPVPAGRVVPLALTQFVDTFRSQITGYAVLFRHPAANAGQLSGVIGMERAAASIQDLGWGPYFGLAAIISIALGLLNLLPFPALDGGRAIFIVLEMVRGRPVKPEQEALVHFGGFAILMALMVVIAFHDISNIVSGKGAL